MSVTLLHHAVDGAWRRRGVPVGGGNSRESLVYGDFFPEDGVNCGLIDENILTPYNSSSATSVTLPDGAVIENRIIYGDLRPPSVHNSDIIIRNCILAGGSHIPSFNDGIVNCSANRSGNGKVMIYDSEVRPQRIALNRDGIRGNKWEAHRVVVRDTIDAFAPYAASNINGGNADVVIAGCIGEQLRYMYPDYDNGVSGPAEHSDGTHNDIVQIHGGRNIHVIGCFLNATSLPMDGTGTPSDKPWLVNSGWARGACVVSAIDTDVVPDTSVVIERNWLRGGLAHVNIKVYQEFVFSHNRHFHETASGSGHSGYWIRYDYRVASPNHSTIHGVNINGTTTVDNTTNVWWDAPNAGQPLTTPRPSGVHFNTAP